MKSRNVIGNLSAWSILVAATLTASVASAALQPSQIVGSWEAVVVQHEGRVIEIDKDDGVVVKFAGGKVPTFKLAMALGPLRRVLEGTWRIEASKLVMTDMDTGEASRATVEFRGPLIVLTADSGMTLVMQRGDGS